MSFVAIVVLLGAVAPRGAPADSCVVWVTPRGSAARGLPHGFHDQALESIRALHPTARILVTRRSGALGEVEYGLVAYQVMPSDTVRIAAIAVRGPDRAAWDDEARCAAADWSLGLVRTLEALASLPRSPTSGR